MIRMRSQRVNNFFAKNFRDISHLIALIVSDLPRARQNVRFRSFPNHRTLLYQRLKIGILRRKVAKLPPLQSLDLSRTQVADLAPLKGLAALQRLNLSWTQVADLAPLKGLAKLQRLNLIGTHFTDLEPLKGLTKLQIDR